MRVTGVGKGNFRVAVAMQDTVVELKRSKREEFDTNGVLIGVRLC